MKLFSVLLATLATITLAKPVEERQTVVLQNAAIRFHTNNDDKDDDTHVTVTLIDGNGVVAARISNDFGHFNDHSDSGPYPLNIENHSQKGDLQSGNIILHIDPNGHDTWKFNFFLDMTFSDGSRFSGGADDLVMTQDRNQQSFGINGIHRG